MGGSDKDQENQTCNRACESCNPKSEIPVGPRHKPRHWLPLLFCGMNLARDVKFQEYERGCDSMQNVTSNKLRSLRMGQGSRKGLRIKSTCPANMPGPQYHPHVPRRVPATLTGLQRGYNLYTQARCVQELRIMILCARTTIISQVCT